MVKRTKAVRLKKTNKKKSAGTKIRESTIESLAHCIEYIQEHCTDGIVLFRGQNVDKVLVPRIGRIKHKYTITKAERKMFRDFKKKAISLLDYKPKDSWEWLAIAQHYGMATRLLDWTQNPLAALWFAVSKPPEKNEEGALQNGVVWIYEPQEDHFRFKGRSPFTLQETRVFQPNHVTRRIVVQSGWFTVHKYYSPKDKFTAFERIRKIKPFLRKLIIPANEFSDIRFHLDRCGINSASLFPDLDGLCENIEWVHTLSEDEEDFTSS